MLYLLPGGLESLAEAFCLKISRDEFKIALEFADGLVVKPGYLKHVYLVVADKWLELTWNFDATEARSRCPQKHHSRIPDSFPLCLFLP